MNTDEIELQTMNGPVFDPITGEKITSADKELDARKKIDQIDKGPAHPTYRKSRVQFLFLFLLQDLFVHYYFFYLTIHLLLGFSPWLFIF